MDIVFFTPHIISLIAIAIMIGTIVIAYLKRIVVTYSLIIANLLVFFLSVVFRQEIIGDVVNIAQYPGLGFRPMYLSLEFLPQNYTLFTAMFLHADVLHLVGNMLVFFFMGMAFEDRIGWKRFLLIYLVTGVCGSLMHSVLNLGPNEARIPLVGASGAIFGILGAFAYAYPWDEVLMPVPIGIMIIMKVKVLYAALLFAGLETVFVFFGGQQNTAHMAHFGGLVSGVLIAALVVGRKKDVVFDGEKRMQYETTFSKYGMQQRSIDYEGLRELAVTPELRRMLERIEGENVAQVRDIWLEHFLQQVHCPVCGKSLRVTDNKVFCEDSHFSKSY